MAFIQQELDRGLEIWGNRVNWPEDLHNGFYRELERVNGIGLFTTDWWEVILGHLTEWHATRGVAGNILSERAVARFEQLRSIWDKDIAPCLKENLDISSVEWLRIETFYMKISKIKNVNSPVFGSKMCHFLAPKIFPVIDRELMGLPFEDYEEYYIKGQQEWMETAEGLRDDLVGMLRDRIPDMIEHYPVKCKIIELCYIGRNR